MTESRKPAKNRGETRDDALEDNYEDDRDDNRDESRDENRDESRDESRDETGDDSQESSKQSQPGDNEDSEDPRPEPGAGEVADDHRIRSRRSGPLVWVALLVALASLGLVSYPHVSNWLNPHTAEQNGPSDSEFERLAGRVDAIRQDSVAELEDLRDELDKLSSDFEAEAQGPDASVLAERIDQLSARLERLQGERNTDLGGLRTRLEGLESEVGRRLEQFELRLSNVGSNLDRADHDLATRLLLMEVDSLFAIAQNHLVSNGGGDVALEAWDRATTRLTALDGAEFKGLKETARREFEQLQEYRPQDLGAQIEQLFGMADSVAEWPVNTIQPGQQAADAGSDEGWRARLGQVVGSLVRVESVDREFLGPDEIDMARDRVRSTLQTAALAIARSRPDVARGLIGEAADAVRRVFDIDATNVSEALRRLEALASSIDRVEPPELADSRAEISRLLGDLR